MKKILFIIILSLLAVIFISCENNKLNNEKSEFEVFLEKNNIKENDIKPYLEFKRFIYYDYFSLEDLRIKNNYSYLEAVNYYYLQDENESLLLGTNYVLVNKKFSLSPTYIPPLVCLDNYPINTVKEGIYLKREVLLKLLEFLEEYELDNIYVFSGYRSFERQNEIYSLDPLNKYRAKPGESEHQTGLAVDISLLDFGLTVDFMHTAEYYVIKENCHKSGFIIRYKEDKEDITNYPFEPWHLRYVGESVATYIYNNNLTLEEFLFSNVEM